MAQAHGYSGKPLAIKMGLKTGDKCLVIKPPEHYDALLADATGVRFVKSSKAADVVHVFCRNQESMPTLVSRGMGSVGENGMLWVSWPKKSSELFRDLTEQDFRDFLLPQGWVDVKVCAVDEDWSGLKFVRRKNSGTRTQKSSRG